MSNISNFPSRAAELRSYIADLDEAERAYLEPQLRMVEAYENALWNAFAEGDIDTALSISRVYNPLVRQITNTKQLAHNRKMAESRDKRLAEIAASKQSTVEDTPLYQAMKEAGMLNE